jgi:hypothetical protein
MQFSKILQKKNKKILRNPYTTPTKAPKARAKMEKRGRKRNHYMGLSIEPTNSMGIDNMATKFSTINSRSKT